MEWLVDLLSLLLAALLGARLALWQSARLAKDRRARTARNLCVAFWEELSATAFYGPASAPNFAGFSSQVFDTLFGEMADSLPETLVRDVMRYHWRMKYMEDHKRYTIPTTGGVNPKFWEEMRSLHDNLRTRLKLYSERAHEDILRRPDEDESVLRSVKRPEMEEAVMALESGREPEVRVQIQRGATDHFMIVNAGLAPARNVDLTILDKPDPIPDDERAEKLPIGELRSGEQRSFVVAFAKGRYPPFQAHITWKDAGGRSYSREVTIDV